MTAPRPITTIADAAWHASSVSLTIRPRWKRVFKVPSLVRTYHRAGVPVHIAIRLAWAVVTFRLVWTPGTSVPQPQPQAVASHPCPACGLLCDCHMPDDCIHLCAPDAFAWVDDD